MIEQIETRYGRMFVPDTDEGQYWWLKNTEASPEDAYIEMVCGVLDGLPRGIAVDVGANFGCWTLPLAKCCSEVHSFEPQMHVCDILRKSVQANELSHVTVYNMAVGETDGIAFVPDILLDRTTNFGGVSINRPHPEHPESRMGNVPQVCLDTIFADKQVVFIKADVEGSELSVLKGAHSLIMRCRPILFVEALHPLTDSDELADYIQAMDYGIQPHLDNFLALPL